MTYVLSLKSKSRLAGVHPDLIAVVILAITKTAHDFAVLEGLRSVEQCYKNWGQGRTASQCVAAGVPLQFAAPNAPKVTWLKDPLNSKHCKAVDGFGHAVDLVPYPIDFKNMAAYGQIATAMQQAAAILGVKIRWGGDWNSNGKQERGENDMGHFELC